MKTVKEGNLNPTWVGRNIRCTGCHGEYQLEIGDAVRRVSDQRGGDYYEASCPKCSSHMTLDVRIGR